MSVYFPHTSEDIRKMLEVVGKSSLDALFDDLPASLRLQRPLRLEPGMTEHKLTRRLTSLAERNTPVGQLACFLGAGAYDHIVPAAVDALASRQEFFTAYTPYQPEISQGTLQALFEYQTMICMLTGLEVSNASLYDAASACVEAARMAMAHTRRSRVLVSSGVHPHVLAALRSSLAAVGATVAEVPLCDGLTDRAALLLQLKEEAAGVILQSPNFLGYIEDLSGFSGPVHQSGAILMQCVMDALSMAVLKTPGDAGADIAFGSGQCFGGGLTFGGPYFGFIASTGKLMRRLPGRIIGQTVDRDGRRAFVLTLQAREQHIRREKATSNVCTNHSLCALRAAIYLALLGPRGLRRTAEDGMRKARRLEAGLISSGAFGPVSSAPYFREFTLRYRGDRTALNASLVVQGFLGGFNLDDTGLYMCHDWLENAFVFCATEKNTEEEIIRFVRTIKEIFTESAATGGVK